MKSSDSEKELLLQAVHCNDQSPRRCTHRLIVTSSNLALKIYLEVPTCTEALEKSCGKQKARASDIDVGVSPHGCQPRTMAVNHDDLETALDWSLSPESFPALLVGRQAASGVNMRVVAKSDKVVMERRRTPVCHRIS